ncbi:pyridoxamine 5'-phosphate oxidase family protein [Granulicoccus sp. GXG6511]|uniref:pyridoxamine 5'-phosphate oxidase family protein n=1 Tax=Granulicoccus sp. GXG6511 TaxID=3381351 RepID=UPI003D7E3E70
MTEAPNPTENRRKVAELIKGVRIAMLTTIDEAGRLVSRPMTTQDVEFDGSIWFIAQRDSDLARQIEAGRVEANVAYAGSSSWVSVSGKARVVNDPVKLRDEWNRFTDAFFESGPDDPNNVLILVEGESAEYWDSPGGKVTQLAQLAKSLITKEPVEGENKVMDL